jgi:hypothetical protein
MRSTRKTELSTLRKVILTVLPDFCQEEKLELLRGLEIQILTLHLELAEENLVLTRGELKNFQSKLGCVDVMLLRLWIAEEKAQKMEEKL